MNKKYGDKAEISGAAAAAWDGVFVLAHALKSAKSTSGPDMITALMTAKTSGPRGDLSFKNRHYVSMTTYLVNEQKDGTAKLIGKFAADHADSRQPDLLTLIQTLEEDIR